MNMLSINIWATVLIIASLNLYANAENSYSDNKIGPETNQVKSNKIDVWDFGAVQLDETQFNNHLTVDIINSWYAPTITPGSNGNVLPNFTSGILSWFGGNNDRLRTTNTIITRFDENIASVTGYTGRVYVNASASADRHLRLTLAEDDEVTIITKTDGGGTINFQLADNPTLQTDKVEIATSLTELKFVAKTAGDYKIFDTQGKPSYYRIYRKNANYITIHGQTNESEAPGIADSYSIAFRNFAGKTWQSTVSNGAFEVTLPSGYTYELTLIGASGYIISNGKTLVVTESTTSHSITIEKVNLFTLSGSINGLGSEIDKLQLLFLPEANSGAIFTPNPEIFSSTSTYSVMLEPNVNYTVIAEEVNDFKLTNNSIKIGDENATTDLNFEPKPRYNVSISTNLTSEQQSKLGLILSNLNEDGYSYSFNDVSNISLRDGIYIIDFFGLDDYALELGLTSNLKVEGQTTSKTLDFKPITSWRFNEKIISTGTTVYKGLLFTGSVTNEVAKGHLVAKPTATIKVPINPGEKVRIGYYYSAHFTIDGGGTFTTTSNSTNTIEYASHNYQGSQPGYVTLTIGSNVSTTYITSIEVTKAVAYKSMIKVGSNREYKTINEALAAVKQMVRENDERVTIAINPGNYEEMLVIDMPNITLKNSAASPSIEIKNMGVDIADGAVRITSYYGHGYHYYSMGSNQKWNADVLRVNRENGYHSHNNSGAGTTNGSYWNATVVITANGFTAEGIIFENSFNQYISKRETEDILVEFKLGSKGVRPTDVGNTDVQDKAWVERAAAIAITDNADKIILNKCRVIGRQDSFFGGANARVVVYKGDMMGAVDYIFGGMNAVFYQSNLVMNTSDNSNDLSYITAAQQTRGRGYLMYECTITSTVPGAETASTYRAKPGYFGRPWLSSTSEVVFYNTTIETSNYPGFDGKSLIMPLGWQSTLGGESTFMYEFGSVEQSGENNLNGRAKWSTVLSSPTLLDNTEITPFNFTKGNDGWNPIPELIAAETEVGIASVQPESAVQIYSSGSQLYISNVQNNAQVRIYNPSGSLVKSFATQADTTLNLNPGLWIVRVNCIDGQKAVRVVSR